MLSIRDLFLLKDFHMLQNPLCRKNPLCYKIPFAAKIPFATKSPLLQNSLCYKIPFAAKSLFTAKFLFATKSSLLQIPFCCKGPEGFQRATGKPFGRLRRGEILCDTGKVRKALFLPPTGNLFLVGGFVRLRADEVLSHTGKYPKGAGGGQRVHVSWPPPDPPLLRNSAPLASQGRAQLGSRPSLGGPLSPSRLAFTS